MKRGSGARELLSAISLPSIPNNLNISKGAGQRRFFPPLPIAKTPPKGAGTRLSGLPDGAQDVRGFLQHFQNLEQSFPQALQSSLRLPHLLAQFLHARLHALQLLHAPRNLVRVRPATSTQARRQPWALLSACLPHRIWPAAHIHMPLFTSVLICMSDSQCFDLPCACACRRPSHACVCLSVCFAVGELPHPCACQAPV